MHTHELEPIGLHAFRVLKSVSRKRAAEPKPGRQFREANSRWKREAGTTWTPRQRR